MINTLLLNLTITLIINIGRVVKNYQVIITHSDYVIN